MIDPDDPRIREVLCTMLAESDAFADPWSRHHVRGKSLQQKRFRHSDVGEIVLVMQAFGVRSSPSQETDRRLRTTLAPTAPAPEAVAPAAGPGTTGGLR